MNKYIVTRPLEHPRDTITYSVEPPPQEMFEVEADFYSVSGEGTAHFYRNPEGRDTLNYKPELITSVSPPFVVRKKEEGTGGRGMVAWGGVPWEPWNSPQWRFDTGGPVGNDPVSFLASLIKVSRDESLSPESRDDAAALLDALRAREPLVYGRDWGYKPADSPPKPETPTVPVELTFAELAVLRSGITLEAQRAVTTNNAADAASSRTTQGAIDSKLDAKLYSSQVILKSQESARKVFDHGTDWYKQGGFPPGTFKTEPSTKVSIRYRGANGRTYTRQVSVPHKDSFFIDLTEG